MRKTDVKQEEKREQRDAEEKALKEYLQCSHLHLTLANDDGPDPLLAVQEQARCMQTSGGCLRRPLFILGVGQLTQRKKR